MPGRFGGHCGVSKARQTDKRHSAAATKEVLEEYWVDTSQLHLQLSAAQRIGMPIPVLIVSSTSWFVFLNGFKSDGVNQKYFRRERFDLGGMTS